MSGGLDGISGPVLLSEATINTVTGVVGTKGPITVGPLPVGFVIVGATYDPAAQTWHVLYGVPENQ